MGSPLRVIRSILVICFTLYEPTNRYIASHRNTRMSYLTGIPFCPFCRILTIMPARRVVQRKISPFLVEFLMLRGKVPAFQTLDKAFAAFLGTAAMLSCAFCPNCPILQRAILSDLGLPILQACCRSVVFVVAPTSRHRRPVINCLFFSKFSPLT